MKTYSCIKHIVAIVAAVIFTLSARGEDATVDGLQFSYSSNSGCYLRKAVKGVPAEVVVPASVEFGKGGVRPVTQWYEYAFDASEDPQTHQRGVCSEVVSVKTEDGEGELYIFGVCFRNLPKLKVIELPVQLAKIDCDLVANCPALESVTIRSPRTIQIISPYASAPVPAKIHALYVQPELVSAYKELAKSGDEYEKYFLGQFEEILPIGAEDPGVPGGVHILAGDLHMNLVDARPGDLLTIAAPADSVLKYIDIDGKRTEYPEPRQVTVTVPDFDHHMVMAIHTATPGMSAYPEIKADEATGPVHSTADGYRIDRYDGTPVVVIDLNGRTVRHTHKSTDTLPRGTYILFYNQKGHKIIVRG